nr:MAG TPA: hypothetical protein [Crassvirales sp.]
MIFTQPIFSFEISIKKIRLSSQTGGFDFLTF